MESELMEDEAPIGQVMERWKAWDEVFLMREGFQEVVYLHKIVVPARDTKKRQVYKPQYPMDKQVKVVVLYSKSTQ
jgi:hypothetical protein